MKISEEHETHHHFLSGWRFKAMIATIILSVLGYILFTFWGGREQVWDAIQRVGFVGIGAALLLSLANYFLRFMRWQNFLHVLGYHIPWWNSFKIYMAGFALTTTPGKAGEAMRSLFLKDLGVPYRQSFGAFLAERLSDLLAVMVLTLAGLWLHPEVRVLVVAVAAVLVFVLVALQNDRWMHWVETKANEKLNGRFGHVMEFGIETIVAFRSCFRPSTLLYGTFLGVVAWAAEGIAFYYLLVLLNADIGVLPALFIYAFSLVIGAITFLPGGLGGVEVAMLQLLLIRGVPAYDAVAVTIVIRLTTLWFSVLLGLIALPKKQVVVRS